MSEQQPPQTPKQDLEVTLPATPATGSHHPQAGSAAPAVPGTHPSSTPGTHGTPGTPGSHGAPGARAHVRVNLKHSVQDLCDDKLILAATRAEFDAKLVPSLGGIPLLAKLGQGGMGAVYYGLHPRLNKEVAVKVLPFNLVDRNPELIDRFFREAQLASNVQSPHLVTVTDVNEESGLFYLVMEYVHGTTGGAYLRSLNERGMIGVPEAEALDLCIAATVGLAAAHEAGIIHRDVKPDNILIPRHVTSSHGHETKPLPGAAEPHEYDFRRAKLSDLGLARTDELSDSLTGADLCMGTPGYMSPEQAMDAKSCGKPADVFSMGAALYALLTGNAPFRESTLLRVLLATRNDAYPPILSLRSDISAPTVNLIDRCLAKDPAKRYADGAELLEAISLCRKAIIDPSADTQPMAKAAVRVSQTPEAVERAKSPSTYVGKTSEPQTATPAAALAPTLVGPTPVLTPVPHPQPAPGIGMGRLIAAGIVIVTAAAGAYAWHQHQLEVAAAAQFKSDVSHAVTGGKAAAGKSGDELSKAIAALEAVVDPDARHGEADIKPAQELLASLTARRELLDKRKAEFDHMLAEAQKQSKTSLVVAIKGLTQAEEFGAADETKVLPDLLGTAQPSIPIRKMELRSLMDRHEKSFQTNADAARKARAELDWARVQECAEKALKSLADLKHPDKADVELLLKEAQEAQDAFGFNLHEGERLLKAGDFANAKAAFEKAKAAWPKAPDIGKVEEGIAAAAKK